MNFLDRERKAFFHTYKRLPLEIDRGEGVYLYDKSGRRYLDLFGGLAVNSLGYGHPGVIRAIERQSRRFIHLSNYFVSDVTLELAETIIRHTGYARVFFSNSGTEAIEGSVKIARLWGSTRGKTQIVSFTNGFHGRTYGALSMMDRQRYKAGFEPFLDNFSILPYNDPAGLVIDENTLAVFLEFIQGEGGIVPADREFISGIMRLKEKFGFLVVADEIQTGLGRTGKPFAFRHYDIEPDLVVIAKPLGGGLPIGAILGSEGIAGVLDTGQHGTTFGGNPVACAAGIEVMKEIFGSGIMQNAHDTGNYFIDRLKQMQKEFPGLIREVRGMGLMIGVELTEPGDHIVAEMLRQGVLANCTHQTVIRIVPPLIITRREVDDALVVIRSAFGKSK